MKASQQTKQMRVCQSERARCAKIIRHGIKNDCLNQASVFAFDTSITSAQAITALGVSKIAANVGKHPDKQSTHNVAAQIIAAGSKRRGEI